MHRNILSVAILILATAFLVHGYPKAVAGPSVNLGSNPLVSAAGNSGSALFTAPSDQLIVITDVILTASGSNSYQPCVSTVIISSSSGAQLGVFEITADTNSNESSSHPSGTISHAFAGGIPLPAGEQASISMSGNCSVKYVVSGRYTNP